jgi:hypothetical protein
LGFESGRFRGTVAAEEELADPVSKFGQRSVLRIAYFSFHPSIIS